MPSVATNHRSPDPSPGPTDHEHVSVTRLPRSSSGAGGSGPSELITFMTHAYSSLRHFQASVEETQHVLAYSGASFSRVRTFSCTCRQVGCRVETVPKSAGSWIGEQAWSAHKRRWAGCWAGRRA